jgi:hypothetical protein
MRNKIPFRTLPGFLLLLVTAINHDDMRLLYERYLEELSEKLRAAEEAFGKMFNALIESFS